MTDIFNMDEQDSNILSNFAGINKQIQFWPGSTLVTVSRGERMMGRAKTNMKFNRTVAIDNLSQLLNAISLFKEPKIVMQDNYLTIQDATHQMRYIYTNPENVSTYNPEKEIKMTPSYSFALSAENLKDIQKAAGVLSMPQIAFVGNGKVAMMQVLNIKNPTSHLYSMIVGKTDMTFLMAMNVEWLSKVCMGDYEVSLDLEKKFAHFTSDQVEYWMAMEDEE